MDTAERGYIELLQRYPGFTSFKSAGPIHYPRRWLRDVLIQAALDPAIEEMGPCPLHPDNLGNGIEFAFQVRYRSARVIIAVSETAPAIALPADYNAVLTLRRADVLRQPQVATGRSIWRQKNSYVDAGTLVQIIGIVSSAADGVTLRDAMSAFSGPDLETINLILALVAQGYLAVDIRNGLTPSTPLKLGLLSVPKLQLRESGRCDQRAER